MKITLLRFAILIASISSYAQVNYEKGYYVTNSGEKIECLIKNLGWKNTPTKFSYKHNESSPSKTNNIQNTKEFGVYNSFKYVRSEVLIDRSSNLIKKLSDKRNAILKNEKIFLKVLVDGSANLYLYTDGNLTRFFYSTDNKKINQLIYKKYIINNSRIAKNNRYKQQLLNNLKCSKTSSKEIKTLRYNSNSLSKYFIKYNKCKNPNFKKVTNESNKRKAFNVTVKAGLNSSSLSIKNSANNYLDANFGNKKGFTFALEGEYILPFNKNKWSIFIEPTYQSFKGETNVSYSLLSDVRSKIDYKSIQLPLGLKYYFFLNNNSKIYVSTALVLDFNSNSSIEFTRKDGSNIKTLDITKANSSLTFGLGYQFKRYSVELKYNNRNILNEYISWSTDYKTLSLNLGYTIF